jgi:hypothetical protein
MLTIGIINKLLPPRHYCCCSQYSSAVDDDDSPSFLPSFLPSFGHKFDAHNAHLACDYMMAFMIDADEAAGICLSERCGLTKQ